jgi:uncharacterized LabA/DUF88 family protein
VCENTSQRLGIFVDVQNMFYSAKTLHQSKIEYSKLLGSIVQGRQLVRALAYVVQKPDVDQAGFLEALARAGFEVKAKELRLRGDGTCKGDWDMGIALDAMALSRKLDTVVLVTGDGDFTPLVEMLSRHGCRVEVFSFLESTSNDLMRAADQFIPISDDVLFKERKFMNPPEIHREEPVPEEASEHYAWSGSREGAGEVEAERGGHAYDPDEDV